jgi:hypothetical protein
MMTDDHTYMILGAQNLIKNQIEKKMRDKMVGCIWGKPSLGLGPNEYELVIYRGEKKLIVPFNRGELIEDYGSTKWKKRLLARVNEIFRRMET